MSPFRQTSFILGIDAGTSRIKSIIFDETGNEVYCVASDCPVICENGQMEIDMNELWSTVSQNIFSAISRSGIERKNIRSVVFTGQGEGAWFLDKEKNPVNKAILWNDCKAVEIVNRIREDEVLFDEIKNTTGSYPRPGSTIVLLKWYKENRPEEYRKIRYSLSCKDWLRYKLTSELYSDYTDASTSCLDIRTKQYATNIFEKTGIVEALSFFPQLKKPIEICGTVTRKAEEETLIPEGTAVTTGMLDIVATSVGAGAVNTGDVCTVLGTSCINEITSDSFVFEKDMTGWEYHMVDGLYIHVAGAMSGTPNLDWGLSRFMGIGVFDTKTIEEIERELQKVPVGSNGLIYHPYISLSGERAPFFNPNATGQISGFNLNTTKYEMLRSIYEGVALSAKDCLAKLTTNGRLFLTGGGARSRFWAQVIADCVGREVVISKGEEFSAKGGAIAAALASGLFSDVSEAVSVFCRAKEYIEPDTQNTRKYNDIYQIYKEMRVQSTNFWNWRKRFVS